MNGKSLVSLVAAGLTGLALMPSALWAEPIAIVAFGDSTTAPRMVNGRPLEVYADRLRRELPRAGIDPLDIVNAGVGGHSTADARRRFERDVLKRGPDLVVIQFGINDSAVDVWKDPPATAPRVAIETYEANLRHFVEALEAQGVHVVLMTPNPMRWTPHLKELYGKPPYDTDDLRGFNVLLDNYADVVRQIARDKRVPLVDVFTLFEDYGQANGRSVDELLLDGMHPNAAGHRLISERLAPEIAALLALRSAIVRPKRADDVFAPVVVRESPENEANVVALPDGTLKLFFVQGFHKLASTASADGGLTWSEPVTEFPFAGRSAHAIRMLLDREGELHAFFLIFRGAGRRLAVDRFLDIWHVRSQGGRQTWSAPQQVFAGYCGALRGVAELPSGRLVLAFASAVPDRPAAPPTGQSVSTTVFSDDGGQTWQQSEAQLTAPCLPNYNGNNYGAVEPSLLPLKDGRVWMLIRTQTGRLYEAFSNDGANWSETRPSLFYCSNSPAAQLRLSDGRIVVFWNNCQLPPRVDGQGVYGGRDALHAAISADEGSTWRGMREVYRDPTRNLPPPRRGDRGTAYANAAETKDGKILLTTGQGAGRRAVLLFDPDWLLETEQSEDFSSGLEAWSTFKSVGPASGYWRNRIPGCELADDPTATDNPKRVLHLRRPPGEPPDVALWNFPVGRNGTVSFDILTPPDSGGISVSLADRLIEPTDPAGEHENLFHVAIDGGRRIGTSHALRPDRWHRMALKWDLAAGRCRVIVDDQLVHTLAGLPDAQGSLGASYLRLASTAADTDSTGSFIRSVHVVVSTPEE